MNGYLRIKQLAAAELSETERRMLSDVNISEPLKSSITEFLSTPSKRIRPLLAILYSKAQGLEITDEKFEILAAVELVHNASLIHDDIIDESSIRRAKKTISAQFGTKTGVIAGDYLLSIAMEKIAGLNNNAIPAKFAQTLKQMCKGEINQNFNRYKIGTIEEYIEKSKNKTGYLFECAIECTAQSGSDFGLNFGIAFQIRDDLNNILKKDFSKPSTDIEEGIYTAPVIYGGSVENCMQGIEKTRTLLNNYVDKAGKSLQNLQDNIYTRALYDLLELLKNE